MTTARNGTLEPVAAYLAGLARPGLGGVADGELLGRFARGRDEAAFAELVGRHGGLVRAACVRALGDAHAEADDCTQAVFLVLARRAGQLAGPVGVAGFLHGVAVRVAWKARDKAHRRRRAEAAAGRPEACTPSWPDDTAAAVDRAVRSLPAALRDVVVLCDLAGVSRRDAAKRLGIPEGTLSSRRSAAHARLARRLGPTVGLPALLAAGLSAEAMAGAVRLAVGPAGAVPAAVQSLVTGVLTAMLIAKLKPVVVVGILVAAACGTAVGVAQVGGQTPAKPAAEAKVPAAEGKAPTAEAKAPKPPGSPNWEDDRKFLRNIWEVQSVKHVVWWASGVQTRTDDIRLDAAGGLRGMYFDDQGKCGVIVNDLRFGRVRPGVSVDVPVRLSRDRKPREMTLVMTDEGRPELWQMIYEPLADGRLRLAYCDDWTASDRPTSFARPVAPYGQSEEMGSYKVVELAPRVKPGTKWNDVNYHAALERLGFPLIVPGAAGAAGTLRSAAPPRR